MQDFAWMEDLFVCPACKQPVHRCSSAYECRDCQKRYEVIDGIPVFVDLEHHPDAAEILGRDAVSEDALSVSENRLMQQVRAHHYVSLMEKKVEDFLHRLTIPGVVLDVGVGWGWHWRHTDRPIIGIDFSLQSLRVAQKILGTRSTKVLLICADAAALPFRDALFAGVWSVQTFQHFPPGRFEQALQETQRVLHEGGLIEVRWLNDSALLRTAYWLRGRPYRKEFVTDWYYIRRQRGDELLGVFGEASALTRLAVGYDELLFHPPLRLTHNSRLLALVDDALAVVPGLGHYIANQVVITGVRAARQI